VSGLKFVAIRNEKVARIRSELLVEMPKLAPHVIQNVDFWLGKGQRTMVSLLVLTQDVVCGAW
jgi:hypothetical protein